MSVAPNIGYWEKAGCGAKMENGRRRTSLVHVCTYQSYIIILNSTSPGWSTYLVNNLVSEWWGSKPRPLSLATPLRFIRVQHVSEVWEHPVGCLSHLSSILLILSSALLQRRFVIGSYLWFYSCGHNPQLWPKKRVELVGPQPVIFLLMKPLKAPKLGAATLLWPGATSWCHVKSARLCLGFC